MVNEPVCQREGGCVAPLSAVKLTPADALILKLFSKIPWVEHVTMSKAGIIKRHLNWTEGALIANGYRIPWSPFVLDRLKICESTILKQEDQRVEMALKSDS